MMVFSQNFAQMRIYICYKFAYAFRQGMRASKVLKIISVAAAAALLSACSIEQDGNFLPQIGGSSPTVAVQALGPGAYSIDPSYGYAITTPGIYRFHKDGSAYEICERDMAIAAIKGLSTKVVEHDDSLEDNLASTNFSLSVPGIGVITAPYKKIKVEGYSVTHLVSGDSRSAAEFVLANLGTSCRNDILGANRPYMIVTEVANAKKVYTLSKGAFQAAFAAGPASLSWANPEIKSTTRSNVTFAIQGKYVAAGSKRK
ncbi:hypothetical protein [Mesorhizobium kowhaii]|uniref:hypothetical protein n=1 Tax=Mesorhizobium kowhaii TaxID=1300272 RepID=UPI0011B61294|nr:hypothetical protein [Mesorhizobium kowhaii]